MLKEQQDEAYQWDKTKSIKSYYSSVIKNGNLAIVSLSINVPENLDLL